MATSVNKVILLGNVGKDPEIRSTPNGKRIANLSVATSESWKDKQTQDWKEKTEWNRVVVFRDYLVDKIERSIHRGSKVYVEGKLQTRSWTDQSGNEKYTTEIVIDQFNGDVIPMDKAESKEQPEPEPERRQNPVQSKPSYEDDLADSIPF